MANSRIRFLRADASNLDSNKKLKAGQPLYVVDKNYLVIGNKVDNDKASNALPIDARRIHGYTSDNTNLTNTNTGEYSIEPFKVPLLNLSGIDVNAPDLIYLSINGIEKLIVDTQESSISNDLVPNQTATTTTNNNVTTTTGRNIGTSDKKFDKVYAQTFNGNLNGNASTVTNGIYSVKLQTNLSCNGTDPINTLDILKGGDMLQITCSVVANGSTYYSTGLVKLPDTISNNQVYKCVYTFSVSTVDTSTTPNTITYYNYTLPVDIYHADVSGSYVKYYPMELVQTEYAGSSVTTNLYTSSYTLIDVYKLYK